MRPFPRVTREALWITVMAGGRIMCIYTVSPQERGRELRRRPEHCTQRRERPQGSFTCERSSAVTPRAPRSCFNKDSLRSTVKNMHRSACSLNNTQVSCSLIVPYPLPFCTVTVNAGCNPSDGLFNVAILSAAAFMSWSCCCLVSFKRGGGST